MEFRVLGPLEVTVGGHPVSLAGARTRAVLALLLVHANQVVPSDRLIEELWPGHPPGKAADSLAVRLSELRKAFRSQGEADRLATRPPGYLLRVAPEELDAQRFERLAGEGDAALAAGDAAAAADRLDQALSLWRGPALSDLDTVPAARTEAARLEEKRLAALETRAEALLACGRHRELIAELEALTKAHPLRERFWYQRMLTLYRAGRQADALRAYREVRDILVADLAIEPGAAAAGIQIRAGIHAGEVDLVGEDIAGMSVQITDRVAALARPAEILVSRTIKDLVAGTGITFAERGSHALNGPRDEWPLFAVTGFVRHDARGSGRGTAS